MKREFAFRWLCCLIIAFSISSRVVHAVVNSGGAVYWDVSHGVVDNYRPSGRYGILVNDLAPLGYSFTEGTNPITSASLAGSSVLVIADGSSTFPDYSTSELNAILDFVNSGHGLLILSEINGSSGTPRIQQVANLFHAQTGLAKFPNDDVFSTSVGTHPSVAGVNQIYFRYSSTFTPGDLTVYASYNTMPMLAAGNVGNGRVVLIADGDLFSSAPEDPNPAYFDRADNRQLAESTFAWLNIPEPSTAGLVAVVAAITGFKRIRRR